METPTKEEPEEEFASEVFRLPEGEDLKCYLVDEDGNHIPMKVEQTLIVISD